MKRKLIRIAKNLNIKVFNKHERELLSIYNKYRDYTMIPKELYIDNLKLCKKHFSNEGAIVECGVWRGGMIAGIAEVFKTQNIDYYLYDSFEGLPSVKEIDGRDAKDWQLNKLSPTYYDNCRAEQEFAEKLFNRLGANYKICKGWFEKTIPTNKPIDGISILRLDADWYESTIVCLENLYPLVRQHGLIIIDDYYTWDGCTKAIHDYLSKIKSPSRIRQTKLGTAYILKNETI